MGLKIRKLKNKELNTAQKTERIGDFFSNWKNRLSKARAKNIEFDFSILNIVRENKEKLFNLKLAGFNGIFSLKDGALKRVEKRKEREIQEKEFWEKIEKRLRKFNELKAQLPINVDKEVLATVAGIKSEHKLETENIEIEKINRLLKEINEDLKLESTDNGYLLHNSKDLETAEKNGLEFIINGKDEAKLEVNKLLVNNNQYKKFLSLAEEIEKESKSEIKNRKTSNINKLKRFVEGIKNYVQNIPYFSSILTLGIIPASIIILMSNAFSPVLSTAFIFMTGFPERNNNSGENERLDFDEIKRKIVNVFLKTIKSKEVFDRRFAAERLGEWGGEKAVNALIQALKDEDMYVRSIAAESLGKMRVERAVEPLVDAYKQGSILLRCTIAQALGTIRNESALNKLEKIKNQDESPHVREIAEKIYELSQYNYPVKYHYIRDEEGEIEEKQIKALKDKDEETQWRAAEMLGLIGEESSVIPLREVLKDKNRSMIVRLKAAEALGHIGHKGAVGPLLEALEDGDMEIRYSAAVALGEIGNEFVVEPLIIKVLNRDEDDFVRLGAVKALGARENSEAEQALVDILLNENNEYIRLEAAKALGKIADDRAAGYLINTVQQDSNPDVRSAAQHAHDLIYHAKREENERRGDSNNIIERIYWLIDDLELDENPVVKMNAAKTLGEIGDKMAVKPLIGALKDKDDSVRIEATKALGEIRDERAVGPLIEVLNDDNEIVRYRVKEALIEIGEPAVDGLMKTLGNEDRGVRERAAEVLENIGDERAIAPLQKLAEKDSDQKVRQAAVKAIESLKGKTVEKDTHQDKFMDEINKSGNDLKFTEIEQDSINDAIKEGILNGRAVAVKGKCYIDEIFKGDIEEIAEKLIKELEVEYSSEKARENAKEKLIEFLNYSDLKILRDNLKYLIRKVEISSEYSLRQRRFVVLLTDDGVFRTGGALFHSKDNSIYTHLNTLFSFNVSAYRDMLIEILEHEDRDLQRDRHEEDIDPEKFAVIKQIWHKICERAFYNNIVSPFDEKVIETIKKIEELGLSEFSIQEYTEKTGRDYFKASEELSNLKRIGVLEVKQIGEKEFVYSYKKIPGYMKVKPVIDVEDNHLAKLSKNEKINYLIIQYIKSKKTIFTKKELYNYIKGWMEIREDNVTQRLRKLARTGYLIRMQEEGVTYDYAPSPILADKYNLYYYVDLKETYRKFRQAGVLKLKPVQEDILSIYKEKGSSEITINEIYEEIKKKRKKGIYYFELRDEIEKLENMGLIEVKEWKDPYIGFEMFSKSITEENDENNKNLKLKDIEREKIDGSIKIAIQEGRAAAVEGLADIDEIFETDVNDIAEKLISGFVYDNDKEKEYAKKELIKYLKKNDNRNELKNNLKYIIENAKKSNQDTLKHRRFVVLFAEEKLLKEDDVFRYGDVLFHAGKNSIYTHLDTLNIFRNSKNKNVLNAVLEHEDRDLNKGRHEKDIPDNDFDKVKLLWGAVRKKAFYDNILTPNQKRVFDAVESVVKQKKSEFTVQDVAKKLGVSGKGKISNILLELERLGIGIQYLGKKKGKKIYSYIDLFKYSEEEYASLINEITTEYTDKEKKILNLIIEYVQSISTTFSIRGFYKFYKEYVYENSCKSNIKTLYNKGLLIRKKAGNSYIYTISQSLADKHGLDLSETYKEFEEGAKPGLTPAQQEILEIIRKENLSKFTINDIVKKTGKNYAEVQYVLSLLVRYGILKKENIGSNNLYSYYKDVKPKKKKIAPKKEFRTIEFADEAMEEKIFDLILEYLEKENTIITVGNLYKFNKKKTEQEKIKISRTTLRTHLDNLNKKGLLIRKRIGNTDIYTISKSLAKKYGLDLSETYKEFEEVEKPSLSPVQKEIIDIIKKEDLSEITSRDIVKKTGRKYANVMHILNKLVNMGVLKVENRRGRNFYSYIGESEEDEETDKGLKLEGIYDKDIDKSIIKAIENNRVVAVKGDSNINEIFKGSAEEILESLISDLYPDEAKINARKTLYQYLARSDPNILKKKLNILKNNLKYLAESVAESDKNKKLAVLLTEDDLFSRGRVLLHKKEDSIYIHQDTLSLLRNSYNKYLLNTILKYEEDDIPDEDFKRLKQLWDLRKKLPKFTFNEYDLKQKYDLGEIFEIIHFSEGSYTSLYKIITSKGDFVLRIGEENVNTVKLEGQIREIASEYDLRVAKIIPNQKKEQYSIVDGKTWVVMEFKQGEKGGFGEVEGARLRNSAIQLARFHDVFSGKLEQEEISSTPPDYLNLPIIYLNHIETAESRFKTLVKDIHENDKTGSIMTRKILDSADFIMEQFRILKENIQGNLKNLPKTIIHGDYHPSNLLFKRDDSISAIMDFDYASKGPRIQDVCNIIFEDENRKLDLQKMKKFISAYQRNTDKKLTKDEIMMIPEMLRRQFLQDVFYETYFYTKGVRINEKLIDAKRESIQILDDVDWNKFAEEILEEDNKDQNKFKAGLMLLVPSIMATLLNLEPASAAVEGVNKSGFVIAAFIIYFYFGVAISIFAISKFRNYIRKYTRKVEPRADVLSNSENNYDRKNAVKELAEIKDERKLEPLIEALKDEDKDVRREAAKALKKIGSKRAVEPLIKALKDDDKLVRCEAADALGSIKDNQAIEPLIEGFDEDKRTLVRLHFFNALIKIGGEEAIEASIELVKNLKKENKKGAPNSRYSSLDNEVLVMKDAVKFLGEVKEERAIEPIIGALNDGSKSVHREAVKALISIGEPAVKPLNDFLSTDAIAESFKDEEKFGKNSIWEHKRRNAVYVLGEIGDEESLELLEWTKNNDVNSFVREDAEKAYLKLEKSLKKSRRKNRVLMLLAPSIMATLLNLEPAKAASVGSAAESVEIVPVIVGIIVTGLGVLYISNLARKYVHGNSEEKIIKTFQENEDIDSLIALLSDNSIEVREKATNALVEIGSPAVEPLIQSLENSNWIIRARAAEALGDIGNRKAKESLRGLLLKEENWNVCEKTAEALSALEDKKIVKDFIKKLKNGQEKDRIRAAKIMGVLGEEIAVAPLIKALGDNKSAVRIASIDALGRIGDTHAVNHLIKILEDKDWVVRRRAAEGLGEIGDKKAAIPLQEIARNDKEHPEVVKAAKEALEKLGHEYQEGQKKEEKMDEDIEYIRIEGNTIIVRSEIFDSKPLYKGEKQEQAQKRAHILFSYLTEEAGDRINSEEMEMDWDRDNKDFKNEWTLKDTDIKSGKTDEFLKAAYEMTKGEERRKKEEGKGYTIVEKEYEDFNGFALIAAIAGVAALEALGFAVGQTNIISIPATILVSNNKIDKNGFSFDKFRSFEVKGKEFNDIYAVWLRVVNKFKKAFPIGRDFQDGLNMQYLRGINAMMGAA
ncbi:MAG: HEAT repeat domain-containing protein [Elusimicrobiota bacterium]